MIASTSKCTDCSSLLSEEEVLQSTRQSCEPLCHVCWLKRVQSKTMPLGPAPSTISRIGHYLAHKMLG
jgi:hypothetical protein